MKLTPTHNIVVTRIWLPLKSSTNWLFVQKFVQADNKENIQDQHHYGDVIMDTMASQITSLTIVY